MSRINYTSVHSSNKNPYIISRGVARILVRGGEDQTKFPVRSLEFRFEAVTLCKNLLNEDFYKIFKIYIKIAQKFIKFFQIFKENINKI